MLEEIYRNLLKQYQVTLQIDKEAEIFIAQAGYNPPYGARELRRTVEKLVQMPLSELILAGKLANGSQWQLIQKDDGLEFSIRTQI